MKTPKWSAVIALLVFASPLYAQTITGISGAFSHGGSVTISGSAFGTKPTPAPVVWDNLESGAFSPRWTNNWAYTALAVEASGTNARHANSRFNTVTNFVGNRNIEHATFQGGSNSPKWYCQYWFKLGSDWNWGTNGTLAANLANVKVFRMWSSGSALDNFAMATEGWSNSLIYKSSGPINESDWFEGGFKESWTRDAWHLFQFEYKDSSQRDVRDGSIRMWRDGQLVLEDTTLLTRSTAGSADGEFMRPYGIGFFNSWGDASTDDNHLYMDDAYIDNTWARVEIGNNAVYASSTHREIQIPSAWSANQITVTVNTGSFQAGSPMYLFVIDPNGHVSGGYPLSGAGADTVAPAAPANLHTN